MPIVFGPVNTLVTMGTEFGPVKTPVAMGTLAVVATKGAPKGSTVITGTLATSELPGISPFIAGKMSIGSMSMDSELWLLSSCCTAKISKHFFFLNKLVIKYYRNVPKWIRNSLKAKSGLTHEPRHEKTCLCHMRTTKVQISLCICTVWSAPLLFAA